MIDASDAARSVNLLGALVLRLSDQLVDAVRSATGLTWSDASALVTIADIAPGTSQDALAHVLGLSQSAVTRLVDRLVSAGLARRGAGADGRTRALTVTPSGRRLARRARQARATTTERALGGLTQAEGRRLTGLVQKLLAGAVDEPADAFVICRVCDPTVCHDRGSCPVTHAARVLVSGS